MELVQDTQKVILTKDLLIGFASRYYQEKTGIRFQMDGDFINFKWDNGRKSLEVVSITNHR